MDRVDETYLNEKVHLKLYSHQNVLIRNVQDVSECFDYWDVKLICKDGIIFKSKLEVAMIFAVVANDAVFNLPLDTTIILPDYCKEQITHLVDDIVWKANLQSSIPEHKEAEEETKPFFFEQQQGQTKDLKPHLENIIEDLRKNELKSETTLQPSDENDQSQERGENQRLENPEVTVELKGRKRRKAYTGEIFPGAYRYKCSFCPKRFKQVGHVNHHEQFHTGEHKYSCQFCSKKFHQLWHLQEHERIHTGEKPFKCTQCDKSFAFSSGLKSHERVHSTKQMYKCQYCSRAFNQMANKNTHERLHRGELKFMCSDCGKMFNTKSNMKRHLCKASHGINKKVEPNFGDNKENTIAALSAEVVPQLVADLEAGGGEALVSSHLPPPVVGHVAEEDDDGGHLAIGDDSVAAALIPHLLMGSHSSSDVHHVSGDAGLAHDLLSGMGKMAALLEGAEGEMLDPDPGLIGQLQHHQIPEQGQDQTHEAKLPTHNPTDLDPYHVAHM